MRPPPGGAPYLATISGGASRLDLPRTSPFHVKGTLSSSTQMYSGSLGTSPKRGFLIRSQRGSVGRRATLGSFCLGRPASSRRLTHPEPRNMVTTRHRNTRTRGRVGIARKHSRFVTRAASEFGGEAGRRPLVGRHRLPREPLLGGRFGLDQSQAAREERRARDGRHP